MLHWPGGMTPLCTCLRPTNPPTRQSWKKRSPRRLPEQPDGLCLPARAWRYPGPCLRLGAEHTAGDRVEKPDNTRINIIAPEQLFAGGVRIVAISRTQGAFIVYGMQHGGNISTKRQFRTQRLIGIMKPEKSMAFLSNKMPGDKRPSQDIGAYSPRKPGRGGSTLYCHIGIFSPHGACLFPGHPSPTPRGSPWPCCKADCTRFCCQGIILAREQHYCV